MRKDNKEFILAVFSLIAQVISLILEINLSDDSSAMIAFISLFIITILGIVLIGKKLYKVVMYVNFLEYLMHNDQHDFVLLPKIRMYLHSKKINNKLKIKKIEVTYNITKNTENPDDLLGDMKISYSIIIENNNLPEQFDFVHGNDYSISSPKVKYCYGTRTDYQIMSNNHNMSIAPYWRGALKHYSFALERQYLPQDGDINVSIEVECDKSFAFMKVPRDTIICMPLVFSENIDVLAHNIILHGFGETKFYCDAYKISKKDFHYERQSINCTREHIQDSYKFVSMLYPNRIKGEKAYYFKVGTSELDKEIIN